MTFKNMYSYIYIYIEREKERERERVREEIAVESQLARLYVHL